MAHPDLIHIIQERSAQKLQRPHNTPDLYDHPLPWISIIGERKGVGFSLANQILSNTRNKNKLSSCL
jgi:hypothetical protein